MLTLKELKEKRILLIQAERGFENKIKFWNDNLRFYKDGIICNQMSCYNIFAVLIIGDISITSQIFKKCKSYGISVHLLDYRLNEYANILPNLEGNYLLRSKQYEFEKELDFSKTLVFNKIFNQAQLIKFQKADLVVIKNKIDQAKTMKELLGIEGNFSKNYFKDHFGEMDWKGRQPRLKQDITNLLLDMGYSYLFNFVDSLLRLYGFDTYKGIYHKLFFARRSLSCDLMEPFRPIIDKAIKRAYRLNQIKSSDFRVVGGQYCLDYKKSNKYCGILLEAILANADPIHSYIKEFYVYMLKENQKMPFYKFNPRSK